MDGADLTFPVLALQTTPKWMLLSVIVRSYIVLAELSFRSIAKTTERTFVTWTGHAGGRGFSVEWPILPFGHTVMSVRTYTHQEHAPKGSVRIFET